MIRPLQGWRRNVAFAAIAALFFHAALLLVHNPAQAASNGLTGNSVVLCTSLGLKIVALADIQDDQSDDPSSGKIPAMADIYSCPICLAAQLAGTALSPSEIVLPMPSHASALLTQLTPVRILTGAIIAGSHARAPPSIV